MRAARDTAAQNNLARIRLSCYAGTRQQHEAVLQLCAHGQVAPVGGDGNFTLNKGTGYLSVEVCGVQGDEN